MADWYLLRFKVNTHSLYVVSTQNMELYLIYVSFIFLFFLLQLF